ncbi:MAG: tyrosine-type recombinase/integrase [Fuerstiella sp.]|nr:tyrosine-type recombinase/integrase [Fuerstiella sp.]
MTKRAKNEGSIFQRKSDGRWVGRIQIGVDATTGRKKTKTVYATTETEVLGKLTALRMQAGKSLDFERQKDTLSAFLAWWLENEVEPNRAMNTYRVYETETRLRIVPLIGPMKLQAITGMDIVRWMASMTRKKNSNDMRKRALRTLRVAMNRAVKMRIIDHNPCDAVDMPKVPKREVVPLEPNQCKDLIEECKTDRLGDAMVLAAMTGLRKGEILALEWSAVNIAERILSVRRTIEEVTGHFGTKEPKSASGRRVVMLDQIACDALQRRLDKAKAEGFDPSEVPLVFPNTVGRLHRPSNFLRFVWHPIREAVGIPKDFRFHDLRHTQASLLIAAGVSMKVVQERLGHADYALTANTYSHLLQGAQADAAEKLDNLFAKCT